MVLRSHNVYDFDSARSSGRIGSVRPLDAGDVTTEVNRKDARLVERGHHGRGRLGIIPRGLRPEPERTLVASDRAARLDVWRSLRDRGRAWFGKLP
jgi:hypothetical protein